jgi:hypothetical protein
LRGVTSIGVDGILYNPSEYYRINKKRSSSNGSDDAYANLKHSNGDGNYTDGDDGDDSILQKKTKSSFLWFQTILRNTAAAEPVLHCYNLHEWAMLYRPRGAPEPTSSKYQSHLPLRVTQDVINNTVERKGVYCTHLDALRFFAPAALPLNQNSATTAAAPHSSLPSSSSSSTSSGGGLLPQRSEQLQLEQPGCVHAQMDLLKSCLRLQPFGDCTLLQHVLAVALESPKLDVGDSPYDASSQRYLIVPIPIETSEGRKSYRSRQIALMTASQPLRSELIAVIDLFLQATFATKVIDEVSAKFDESYNCK